MPKITATSIALTALVLLSLTACAGTPETAPSEPAVSGQSAPVETVTPEPTPTVETEPEVTAAYTEEEMIFLPWARMNYNDYRSHSTTLPELTDDEMLTALYTACAAQVDGFAPRDMVVLPGFTEVELDTTEGRANMLFVDAANLGYGEGITGTAGSYCD